MTTYFISAIDTEVGKTIATGLLARHLYQQQNTIITMKVAQTGCEQFSEDIQKHRDLMGMPWQAVDTAGTTCPYLFPHPASPHLSAQLADTSIDIAHIESEWKKLQSNYETILLEGVGGLMVPLTEEYLLIDWLEKQSLPIILVTSGKLGSINHTLLSLFALRQKNLDLYGILYNHFPNTDTIITEDTRSFIRQYQKNIFPNSRWGEILMPSTDKEGPLLKIDSRWFS